MESWFVQVKFFAWLVARVWPLPTSQGWRLSWSRTTGTGPQGWLLQLSIPLPFHRIALATRCLHMTKRMMRLGTPWAFSHGPGTRSTLVPDLSTPTQHSTPASSSTQVSILTFLSIVYICPGLVSVFFPQLSLDRTLSTPFVCAAYRGCLNFIVLVKNLLEFYSVVGGAMVSGAHCISANPRRLSTERERNIGAGTVMSNGFAHQQPVN